MESQRVRSFIKVPAQMDEVLRSFTDAECKLVAGSVKEGIDMMRSLVLSLLETKETNPPSDESDWETVTSSSVEGSVASFEGNDPNVDSDDSEWETITNCSGNESEVDRKPVTQQQWEKPTVHKLETESLESHQGTVAKQKPDPELAFRTLVEKCIIKFDTPLEWDSIVGQDAAKSALMEAVVYPFKYQWYFNDGIDPPQGVLLYGPPGVAKSKLAEIAGSLADAPFFHIKASDIKSKWIGESEKIVQVLFARIEEIGKAIVFIDEIDGLLGKRGNDSKGNSDGIINQFLINLKGNSSERKTWFVIIGATNHPNNIDPAILRRFQRIIPLSLPSCRDRMKIFQSFLKKYEMFTEQDLEIFAVKSEGFSGSDIEVALQDALLQPLRRAISDNCAAAVSRSSLCPISQDDILNALQRKQRTVTTDVLIQLKEFALTHGVVERKVKNAIKKKKRTLLDKLNRLF